MRHHTRNWIGQGKNRYFCISIFQCSDLANALSIRHVDTYIGVSVCISRQKESDRRTKKLRMKNDQVICVQKKERKKLR